MTKKPKDMISRAFRQDFPQFVDRVKALGVRVSLSREKRRPGQSRVYWLDGDWQLTGYVSRKNGEPFTDADAVANIDRILTAVEEDREAIKAMTVSERFARVMADMRKIEPRYRMIGGVRLPCGDRGHCFFLATYAGAVRLRDVGEVASATAKWHDGVSPSDQMALFCDLLEADFRARQHPVAEVAGAA